MLSCGMALGGAGANLAALDHQVMHHRIGVGGEAADWYRSDAHVGGRGARRGVRAGACDRLRGGSEGPGQGMRKPRPLRGLPTIRWSSVLHLELPACYFDAAAGNAIDVQAIGQLSGGERGATLVHGITGYGAADSVEHIDAQ